MGIPIKENYWLNIVTGKIELQATKPDIYFADSKSSLYRLIGSFYKGTRLAAKLEDEIWYIYRPNSHNIVIGVKMIYASTALEPYYFQNIIAKRVVAKLKI